MPARRTAKIKSILIDTNVLLDVLLAREPWAGHALSLLSAVEQKKLRGFVASHTVTTVHYIVQRTSGRTAANIAIADLLSLLEIVPLDSADFSRAIAYGTNDFEDAVQAAACLKIGADFLVTRNAKDFKGMMLSTRAPGEVIALLRPY